MRDARTCLEGEGDPKMHIQKSKGAGRNNWSAVGKISVGLNHPEKFWRKYNHTSHNGVSMFWAYIGHHNPTEP